MYGNKIRQLRKQAGLSQAELADIIGVSRPNISFWEKAAYPPLEAIERVCKALKVDTWKFFINKEILAQIMDIPAEYIELIHKVTELDDEAQEDLLDIFKTILQKYYKISAKEFSFNHIIKKYKPEQRPVNDKGSDIPMDDPLYDTKIDDHYSLNFFARNMGNIAIKEYINSSLLWI